MSDDQTETGKVFWARTLVGGMVATQAASLMFSGHFSKRPTMVYMGKDANGEYIYQNIFFKGAPGDAINLVTNARMTSLGRRLAEIGKALESGAPQGTDDPLLWQLRDLEGDIAAVLNPDLLRTIVEDRGRLQKLVDQLTAYLRDMGINPV